MSKLISEKDTVKIIDQEFNFYLKWCKTENEIEIVTKAFDEIKNELRKLSDRSTLDEAGVYKTFRDQQSYINRLKTTIKTMMEVCKQ